MNIVLKNSYTDSLVELGKELPRPKAIMVISAHWLTNGTYVTCNEKPRTIHDFYGFPKELYEINYQSPGSPDHAELVSNIVSGGQVKCSSEWGLDHASWAVLNHMYPEADIPVFEMSLDYSFNEWNPKIIQHHYDLAAGLGELRRRGVLIIGSGNIVHNLGLIDFRNIDAEPYDWAVEFDEKVRSNLLSGNHRDLIEYMNMGRTASMAVPTLDHYLPMIYAIALQEEDDELKFIHEGFQYGSVSMRCFQIG
ncbi:4,5-DOPA dioxygenase extradiol [Methanococcoides sp. FTZ1]|uniref:4,5-DOPA-extradiol-dioxygenase n=1 Tax=Methanococcoides sp. FTZ1 TaxID=3439061 RepID=UPI003F82C823